jgi:hypothetical protein
MGALVLDGALLLLQSVNAHVSLLAQMSAPSV